MRVFFRMAFIFLCGRLQTFKLLARDIYVRRADTGSAETKEFLKIWIASDGRKLKRKEDGTGGWADLGKTVKGKSKKASEAAEKLYGKELGRIVFERSSGGAGGNKLKLINKNVQLSTAIMKIGNSTKKNDEETAGGHGEVSVFVYIVMLRSSPEPRL